MASRVHLRSGSANSLDNRAFREAISKMRQEVLETKAETQSVRDQLNCLIMLVRRSWMGDQAATAHVANIVGAAPPTFLREDEKKEVNDIKQSRAVHHWAMLSIGLLNRHLRQLEKQALSRSKQRLQERQDFLDYQLTRHRDLLRQAGSRGLVSAKKTANPYLEQAQRQPMVGKGRPKSSRPGLLLAHPLFDHPTKQQALATNMVQHLANTAQVEKEHDLFSASYMVPDRSKVKRPTSGTQKLKDGQRSRPKSAVVSTTKVERPLKYETTRPVSGKPSLDRKRTKSAKASSNPIFEMTQGGATSFSNIHQRKDLLQNQELSLYEDGLSNVTGRHVQMNGGHSHYIDSVTEGLRQMESMEEDFKRTTKMLQQKLGISGEGAI